MSPFYMKPQNGDTLLFFFFFYDLYNGDTLLIEAYDNFVVTKFGSFIYNRRQKTAISLLMVSVAD